MSIKKDPVQNLQGESDWGYITSQFGQGEYINLRPGLFMITPTLAFVDGGFAKLLETLVKKDYANKLDLINFERAWQVKEIILA